MNRLVTMRRPRWCTTVAAIMANVAATTEGVTTIVVGIHIAVGMNTVTETGIDAD